ncbi:MAG TPA: efflux RND transporter periplasmic adaptor subunit [Bacteroidia bacterium]|nr:efflux RND transporter periplasmic adaptor subunit [Bacteroidia bacterium]
MKKIVAIALVAVLAVSCGQGEEDKQKKLEKLKAERADLDKEIAQLEKEAAGLDTVQASTPVRAQIINTVVFKRPVEVQGIVESDKNVVVSSEVAGRVIEVLVKEGQKVSQGQTLARVDGDITASSIREVENALKLAETTYQKQKRLREQNVGTEMQLLQAENQRDALKKQLETLRAQYSKYNITAPVNGTVDMIDINQGENLMPGMPVARVVNNSNLKVAAEVSERYVKTVRTGDSVMLRFPSIDLKMGAKISSVGQIINPGNRTFSMIVNINANTENLKPNLLSMVTIYDYVNPKAIAVPSNVITNDGTSDYVFVVEEKGGKTVARKKVVTVGTIAAAQTEIKDGLQPGDRVITENYKTLTDGAEIKIIK